MFSPPSQFFTVRVASAIGDAAATRALNDALAHLSGTASTRDGCVIAFGLNKAELATTSFVKGSILAIYQSGRLSTESSTISAADAFGIPAFNVFPVLLDANEEVESLTDEIFARRGFAILSIKTAARHEIEWQGKMLGYLDDALLRTMSLWEGDTAFAASELRQKFPQEGISQTAWSNRLNDLWRLRLLRRHRKGKSWNYKPITGGINYGR